MKQINSLRKRCIFMEKMTNKKALMYVVDNFAEMPTDVAEKINAMIASLDKKSTNRKSTKTQEQNESLKEVVMSVLSAEHKTASEIMKLHDELKDLSNQKVASLLNALVKDGKVQKSTEGKKSVFYLA
jgi:ferritin